MFPDLDYSTIVQSNVSSELEADGQLTGHRIRELRDPSLVAIIESVESGGDPVAISVALYSGAVVSGYARRSSKDVVDPLGLHLQRGREEGEALTFDEMLEQARTLADA